MRAVQLFLIILVGVAALVGLNSVYIVSERQQAVVVELGRPVASVNPFGTDDPGLKFKTPFIQNVVYFDKRNLFLDLAPQEITAGETSGDDGAGGGEVTAALGNNERLIIDAFARWRITDPILFLQSVRTKDVGARRITDILNGATREILGTVPSDEIISGQRAALMDRIGERVAQRVAGADIGVELIDVRIKRVELPEANRDQVFARMVSERRQQAAGLRAGGREQALRIRADADRQVRVIVANANEQSERVRGEGDARRNEIYGQVYSRDPEFFDFYRTLLAYEQSIKPGTTLLLSPDSEFFRYFSDQSGTVP